MPSREEGSPHVLLDTMASGTPFVASNIGGVRELVPPGYEKYLCNPEDIDGFANKIKYLLSAELIYDKFRLDGLEFVKRFGKEKGVSEFIGLFQ